MAWKFSSKALSNSFLPVSHIPSVTRFISMLVKPPSWSACLSRVPLHYGSIIGILVRRFTGLTLSCTSHNTYLNPNPLHTVRTALPPLLIIRIGFPGAESRGWKEEGSEIYDTGVEEVVLIPKLLPFHKLNQDDALLHLPLCGDDGSHAWNMGGIASGA